MRQLVTCVIRAHVLLKETAAKLETDDTIPYRSQVATCRWGPLASLDRPFTDPGIQLGDTRDCVTDLPKGRIRAGLKRLFDQSA